MLAVLLLQDFPGRVNGIVAGLELVRPKQSSSSS
jgi:hypothetical protein